MLQCEYLIKIKGKTIGVIFPTAAMVSWDYGSKVHVNSYLGPVFIFPWEMAHLATQWGKWIAISWSGFKPSTTVRSFLKEEEKEKKKRVPTTQLNC